MANCERRLVHMTLLEPYRLGFQPGQRVSNELLRVTSATCNLLRSQPSNTNLPLPSSGKKAYSDDRYRSSSSIDSGQCSTQRWSIQTRNASAESAAYTPLSLNIHAATISVGISKISALLLSHTRVDSVRFATKLYRQPRPIFLVDNGDT